MIPIAIGTGIAFIAAQQDKKSMGRNVNKTAGSCF
jgi:hypothetical protein